MAANAPCGPVGRRPGEGRAGSGGRERGDRPRSRPAGPGPGGSGLGPPGPLLPAATRAAGRASEAASRPRPAEPSLSSGGEILLTCRISPNTRGAEGAGCCPRPRPGGRSAPGLGGAGSPVAPGPHSPGTVPSASSAPGSRPPAPPCRPWRPAARGQQGAPAGPAWVV